MKKLPTLLPALVLLLTAGLAQARDIGPDEALRLRDAGTIQSFETLNRIATDRHPGSTVVETELEEEYGRYIYKIDVRDPQAVKWELEVDAVSGELLKDRQDD